MGHRAKARADAIALIVSPLLALLLTLLPFDPVLQVEGGSEHVSLPRAGPPGT